MTKQRAPSTSLSPCLILIMGVSGTGKTTLAKAVSEKLCWQYLEADDFHSDEARSKMRNGIPLTDEDRQPWIDRIKRNLREMSAAGKSCVLACSGLRRSHRKQLTNTGFGSTQGILLIADYHTLNSRLEKRTDHYMPSSLLQSQIDTLEYPLPAEFIDTIDTTALSAETLLEKVLSSEICSLKIH